MPVGIARHAITVCLILCRLRPAHAMPWSPALLHDAGVWRDHMNGAVVTATDGALRVEVAAGKTWAIAAVPEVTLSDTVEEIRVRVRAVGGGGRWLVRLHGAIRGRGTAGDYGPFQGETTPGPRTLEIDPRLLRLRSHLPLQVQVGVEGPPGAYALFELLDFQAGSTRLRPAPGRTAPGRTAPPQAGQRALEAVDLMPDLPQPFHLIDWRRRALDYDRFVFDFSRRGPYLPLIWLDNAHVNSDRAAFGLCSYVGDGRQGSSHEESVNCLGAVLGATLVGIDKSRQEHDYVAMCRAFYNPQVKLVLNAPGERGGGSFWYDLWPNMVFTALGDRYPREPGLDAIVRTSAERWHDAYRALGGDAAATPNFDHTAFDFGAMKPVDNGHWQEPDAAAGVAWLEYAAWHKFGDTRYLEAAEGSLRSLQQRRDNPYYEVLLPWGALTAARLNAELGRHYDVDRLLNWSFGISDSRGGWGVIVNRWGGYDCAGLVGSVDNRGGYAFAMNTFAQAGALVPLVCYDPRYARAIGKWMLNLANAARLFYPDGLPSPQQSPPLWSVPGGEVIAYEGLRRAWQGQSPCATGDPVAMHWGPATDRGLYGSSYVGMLGAIVGRTSDEKILVLDCLATDFYHPPAYPTKLCYNPYPQPRRITLPTGPGPCAIYDLAAHRFVARHVTGRARVQLDAHAAVVLVLPPAGGKVTRVGNRLLVDGVVVDYATMPGG